MIIEYYQYQEHQFKRLPVKDSLLVKKINIRSDFYCAVQRIGIPVVREKFSFVNTEMWVLFSSKKSLGRLF